MAAAIAFLLLTSIFVYKQFFNLAKSPETLFMAYFEPYDGVTFTRSADTLLSKGLIHYRAKNYEEALTYFLRTSSHERDDRLHLLIASCYISLDEDKESQEWLNKISDDASPLITGNRDWYQALLLLKTGKLNESESLLNQLITTNNPFKKKASKLLNESIFR